MISIMGTGWCFTQITWDTFYSFCIPLLRPWVYFCLQRPIQMTIFWHSWAAGAEESQQFTFAPPHFPLPANDWHECMKAHLFYSGQDNSEIWVLLNTYTTGIGEPSPEVSPWLGFCPASPQTLNQFLLGALPNKPLAQTTLVSANQ